MDRSYIEKGETFIADHAMGPWKIVKPVKAHYQKPTVFRVNSTQFEKFGAHPTQDSMANI